ncbi:MAG: response regulator [Deltaproteobacteria bacterium]|nr:MAG: response regulator [Deltaproteobacteria bacterium]
MSQENPNPHVSATALRESEARMRAMLSALPDMIFRVDRDGTFLDFHAPSPKALAVPPERFLGKNLYEVMPEEVARESLRLIAETLRGGKVSPLQEYSLTIAGEKLDFEARFARCARNEVLAIVRDITDRKRSEESARRNEERIRESYKFEALGRLAGGLAHHLNNMMTVVTGYSDLLLSRVENGDPRRGDIEKIRDAGERAAGLTRELLAFGRRQVLRPRILDVHRFLSQISGTIRDLAGPSIRFAFTSGEDSGKVNADPDRLRAALLQLVSNARDAMPGGGELHLSARVVDLLQGEGGTDAVPGRYVSLTVEDNGSGMDAKTRERIFEPFYTTRMDREGMGLPSVLGFVQQSGGHISVESRPGRGTTIRIWLPCAEREEPAAAIPAAKPGRRRAAILVVTDEAMVRSLLVEVLRRGGYDVLVAGTFKEISAVLAARKGGIDLLIADSDMPGMKSPELVRRVSARQPGIRVLHLSAYPEKEHSGKRASRAGTALLRKPFHTRELLARVELLLGRAPAAP